MDTYLDPSLGGPLAFLDTSTQLHTPSDPSSQPLNFDAFDSWLHPVPQPAYEASSSLSVAHGTPPVAPLSLDGRQTLSSGHFGVVHLHSEPRVNAKSNSAPLSPLSPAAHGSGSMHLPFTGADYPDGMFHSRPNLGSQNYVHASPSAHSEPSTESMSIAMYDRPVGGSAGSGGGGGPPREAVGDYSAGLANLRNSSISSNTSSSSSTARQTLSPTASAHSQPSLARVVPSSTVQKSPLRANQGRSPPTTRSKGNKSSQADESVPEAALHLLRLALPTGSTGSAATNTTGDDERSGDEDAEGESDDTSIHSTDLKALGKLFPDANVQPAPFETTVWNHSEGQPPLHVQRGGGPGSRRPSAASSAASTRIRQHNPARTQREASVASVRSRIGSEAPSVNAQGSSSNLAGPPVSGPAAAVGRRSTRGRRSEAVKMEETGLDSDGEAGEEDKGEESEGEYKEGDAYEDGGDATDTGKGKGRKKATKGGAAVKGKGRATKRASTAADGAPPAKKARGNARAKGPVAPRKPRRQAFIPPNLSNRTFPAGLEISSNFPRFYRSFPISSAIPPDSYVVQLPGSSNSLSSSTSSASHLPPQGLPLDILPTPPTPIYDQHFGFPSHSPYSASHSPPLASPSNASTSGSLPNISVDASGSFVIHDHSHAHSQPHSHSHAHAHTHHPHYAASFSQSPYSLPPPTPGPHEMAPPSLLQPPPQTSAPSPYSHLNLMQPPPEARWNKAGDPFNLYYPRFVKGSADDKRGLCPICSEPPERGGEGEHKWLKLKNSSYVYHMSYSHGLSNVTGLPFSPPLELRHVDLPNVSKDTRAQMTEGHCHKCDEWIPLLSVKNIDAIIPELIWWKHAKKCHGDSTIPGERDPYVVDDLYNFVLSRKNDSTY